MGKLIAFGFDRSWAASEVMKTLRADAALDEAFVVERAVSGQCRIRAACDGNAPEANSTSMGGLWGAMARLVFLNPSLDRSIPRGGSALFLLLQGAAEGRVLRAVKPYGARALKASFPRESLERLTKAA